MSENPIAIFNQEKRELELPFPLMKDLIDYAKERGLSSETSYDDYIKGGAVEGKIRQVIPLPERFSSLVAGYPGTFLLVYYIDRDDQYYKPETRYKEIGISSSEYRKSSDERLTEIHIKQPGVSTGFGNVLRIEVEESINEKSFDKMNDEIGVKTDSSHGSARIEYEVTPDGARREVALASERLDEGMFEWGNEFKHVRWLRYIDVDKRGDTQVISYRDMYLVGLRPQGGSDERAEVKFSIDGNLNEPKSIKVEIGSGPESTAEIFFDDTEHGIKIIVHKHYGVTLEQVYNILRQNPNYAFLFKDPVDVSELRASLASMVATLQNDWDKPQTVFAKPVTIEQSLSQISDTTSTE